jgi:hypothetical protein
MGGPMGNKERENHAIKNFGVLSAYAVKWFREALA